MSSQPIPGTIEEKFAKAQKEARDLERQIEKQKTGPISLTVGTHTGCGGEVVYVSSFGYAGSMSDFRIGGKNPKTESMKCSCKGCGALFDPLFEPYRTQVEKYRNHPIEETTEAKKVE